METARRVEYLIFELMRFGYRWDEQTEALWRNGLRVPRDLCFDVVASFPPAICFTLITSLQTQADVMQLAADARKAVN